MQGWNPVHFFLPLERAGQGSSSHLLLADLISVFYTVTQRTVAKTRSTTYCQIMRNQRSRRGRGVCWKGTGAGLDRYQLAFGLDDANFSIADLEEGAKLFVFPGHTGTRRGVRYNITI